jgi:Ca-activated chloride channel homolog
MYGGGRVKSLARLLVAGLIGVLFAAACSPETPETSSEGPKEFNPDGDVLSIVAGSEQEAVFNEIVAPWCESKNITCSLTKLGSVDQARLLQENPGKQPYDAFWFASKVFEQLGDKQHALQDVQSMFSTPIVYAGGKSEMERLGFAGGRDVSIDEILTAVESKKTTVWVTNPTQSNSGATVFFGFLNHFAGNGPGDALTAQQLGSKQVQTGITRFTRSFDHTPPSTGTLMEECLANTDTCKTMFTYEALVIEYNKRLVAEGKEPLYAVYPQGSLAISDAPLGFMPHADNENNAKKRENFKALQQYLLSGEAQDKLLKLGRRPITSIGIDLPNAPKDTFNPDWGIRATLREQPITYPATPVIETALDNYQTLYRKPVDMYYCIDGSGSMADNDGWTGVQNAAKLLFDPAESKKYLLQVNPQDRTTVDIFNGETVIPPVRVDGNDAGKLRSLKDTIVGTSPNGETGIYRCLGRAADHFEATPPDGRKRLVALMSDGQDTEGGQESMDRMARLKTPVISIAFGDADETTLREIAERTRGAFIGSDDLVGALRQATGYK